MTPLQAIGNATAEHEAVEQPSPKQLQIASLTVALIPTLQCP